MFVYGGQAYVIIFFEFESASATA